MDRDIKKTFLLALALVLFVVPLVAVSFVSLDLYDTLDAEQERILFRAAYTLLFATVLAGILFWTWHRRKDHEQMGTIPDAYEKLLIVLVALNGLSFTWLVVFHRIGLIPVLQMFLFFQVAIVSALRTRLFRN
ncbi:MAG: hypothetical protein ACLFSU_03905 [Acholeplasmataceae bacterium]